MNKYLRSYKMYFGRSSIRQIVILLVAILIVIVVMALAEYAIIITDPEAEEGFGGIAVSVGVMAAVSGTIFQLGLYAYTLPKTPGYKFFAAVPDSVNNLRRAVVTSNCVTILIGIAMTGLSAVVVAAITGSFANISESLSALLLLLLFTGITDFTGFAPVPAKPLAVIIEFCVFGFSAGFIAGFSDSAADSSERAADTLWVMPLIAVISLLVYAGGLAFALTRCGKKDGAA